MIVFQVLRVAIAAFSLLFFAYAIYAFIWPQSGEGDPYFEAKLYSTLFAAGLIMSILLFYITRYLKKHLD